MQAPKWQLSIADILLLMALIASILAAAIADEPPIAFVMACCLGAFIWHRPIVSRLWALGLIGLGAGLFTGGMSGEHSLSMRDGEIMAWGVGMLVGGIGYLLIFTRFVPASRHNPNPPAQ